MFLLDEATAVIQLRCFIWVSVRYSSITSDRLLVRWDCPFQLESKTFTARTMHSNHLCSFRDQSCSMHVKGAKKAETLFADYVHGVCLKLLTLKVLFFLENVVVVWWCKDDLLPAISQAKCDELSMFFSFVSCRPCTEPLTHKRLFAYSSFSFSRTKIKDISLALFLHTLTAAILAWQQQRNTKFAKLTSPSIFFKDSGRVEQAR